MYHRTTDRRLSPNLEVIDTLDHKIEISSILVNRLKNNHDDFIKYDIDVALDEVDNNDSGIKLKYRMVLLSNPTNTKLTAEGIVMLFGSEAEVSKQLEPDQKNIPVIVNVIYQDIYPLVYIICKSMQIPVPAYKLAQLGSSGQTASSPQPKMAEVQAAEPTEELVAEQVSGMEQPPIATEPVDAPVVQ